MSAGSGADPPVRSGRGAGLLGWALATVVAATLAVLALTLLGRPPPAAPAPAAVAAPAAPQLTIAELLAGHSTGWRVARLQENPDVLAIEFPNLAEQGAAMNRLAALLEKADAPRDRVLDDAELAAVIARAGDSAQSFYFGHDYEAAGMARFFALARQQSLRLNDHELRLRGLLVAHGVLAETPEGLLALGAQALITFTAPQADDPATTADEAVDERRRESVLRHEFSHGQFFTRPAYREHSRRFWQEALTEPQREAMRAYLAGQGYDRRNEDLMINEAQAFLIHTSDARAFDAASVGIANAVWAELRARFWRSLPADALAPSLRPAAAAASRP